MQTGIRTSSHTSKENIQPLRLPQIHSATPPSTRLASLPPPPSNIQVRTPLKETAVFSNFDNYLARLRNKHQGLTWDPSSDSPEALRRFADSQITPPPPPPITELPRCCHVCGTAYDLDKSALSALPKNILPRILNVLRIFKISPRSFLVQLLRDSASESATEEFKSFGRLFYSRSFIPELLNLWSRHKMGKNQLLDWCSRDGKEIIFATFAEEGENLALHFAFTSSKVTPEELLGFNMSSISEEVGTVAPTFMAAFRAFAIPPNRANEDFGAKVKMERVVRYV